MTKTALVLVCIIILSAVSLFLFLPKKETAISPSTQSQTSYSQISPVPTTIREENNLPKGGSSYLDKTGIFSFLYPNDYTLDTQDPNHIRIYKKGETQRPQSEMSDGALIVFEPITLQGKSLETWADTRIKEATSDGTSEIIEAKKSVIQNGYPGFYYALRGLGTSQNFVLQKDKNATNAVVITYSISDPQNKGYQKDIDAVLSSIKLFK